MEKIKTKVERYQYNKEYILEVWEEVEECGKIWHFYLARGTTGYKMYMFGWPADQTQAEEPHVYTKKEAIELAEFSVEDYIPLYEEDLDNMEEAFWEAIERR